jgi:hypothetical protein
MHQHSPRRAKAPGTITAPLFFLFYEFAYAISITPCGGREKAPGHPGSCKDTPFSKCLKVGDAIDEDDRRLIRGIIPDMVIDARGRINS